MIIYNLIFKLLKWLYPDYIHEYLNNNNNNNILINYNYFKSMSYLYNSKSLKINLKY